MQDGIASQSYSIADERLNETHTKFSNFELFERQDYVESILRGMGSPLTQEKFVDIMTSRVNEVSGEYLEDFLNRFWGSEIIRFVTEFSTSDDRYLYLIEKYVSISKRDYIEINRSARNDTTIDRAGFIFSYSTRKVRNFGQLMREFSDSLIAVNPVFNEFSNIHVRSPYPIGR